MVLLGGLEFVAAGYLLNKRNELNRESARREAEDDLKSRGYRPENMQEHANKRNEEIQLHRQQTGLLGPPMVGTPGERPRSAPGFVDYLDKQQYPQQWPQQQGWQQQYPNQYGHQGQNPPQSYQHHYQQHHPHHPQPGYMPQQGHTMPLPGHMPPHGHFPPHMTSQFQQGVPMTPPPPYSPAASVPPRGYGPPNGTGGMDAYPRERNDYRGHGSKY